MSSTKVVKGPMLFHIDTFPVATWPELEAISREKCACGHCNNYHSQENPIELTGKCHAGPVYVTYWEGWLCLSCGECRMPIMKVKVEEKLL